MAAATATATQVQTVDRTTKARGSLGTTLTSPAQSPMRRHAPPLCRPAHPPVTCYTPSDPRRGPGRLRPSRSTAPPFPPQSTAQKPFFPEGALYSGFIFQGSANKFLPNCPQTKKVHISALKVTGGIADQVWHICRPPPAVPTICSRGHPLRSSRSPAPNAVHLSSLHLS